MKKILLLGASGSIGSSALSIIRRHSDRFQLCGASCHNNADELTSIGAEFQTTELALSGSTSGPRSFKYSGPKGIIELIESSNADVVINGIAGSAGLAPSARAIELGKDLALANKETVVMAGPVIRSLCKKSGSLILPVDSEHAALFELLHGRKMEEVDSLWLTASGGPFRKRSLKSFPEITLEETLNHPTWNMGKKITIDSATMANKGLELIEAVQLFDMEPSRIRVVIHPSSQVHSLIRTVEGSFYAQISDPDMRLPILNALSWPEKIPSDAGKLDIFNLNLKFSAPDFKRYPMLKLAYEAAETGGTAPIIYNAANEAAVAAFISGSIKYNDIAVHVEQALESASPQQLTVLDDIIALNNECYEACYRKAGGLL